MTNTFEPLPEAVRQLAERLGCEDRGALSQVRLRQVGQMRQGAASAWMGFRARQCIELESCAFEWIARTGPLNAIRVKDAFSDGRGRLTAKLFGLFQVAGASNSVDLDRGELMRYLAELAWAPDAILRNRLLQWRVLDDTHLLVSASDGARRAEVQLTLDQEGRIVEAFAPDRPRAIGNHFEPSAWRGKFSEYRRLKNRLLPTSAEVGWLDGNAYEVVWRGGITYWNAV
jgi:hypothetical protein